jgi:hypothetical protein
MRTDQPAEFRGIDIGHVLEIDQDIEMALPHEGIQPVAECGFALSFQAAFHVDNGDAIHDALV